MKSVVAIILVVSLVGLGVWLLFGQQPEPLVDTPPSLVDTPNTLVPIVESDVEQVASEGQTDLAEGSLSETDVSLSNDQRAEKLAAAKSQLDVLILEYNENLTDVESRAETQAKMEILLKQYNELALPIALAKINEK